MKVLKVLLVSSTALLVLAFPFTSSFADEGGGSLAAAAQNPVGAMISVPLKFGLDFGAPNGEAFTLNVNPVYPMNLGEWNIINRALIPFIDVPRGPTSGRPEIPGITSGDGATGLGDINYTPYISPAKPGKLIWGLGPSITFPTATEDQLGSGKWSGGLSGVLLAQPKPWSLGVLARQLWSFAGDGDRADVNQFLIEPFVTYNLGDGWHIMTDLIIVANWDAPSDQRWTVPLGGGVGRMLKVGNQPMVIRGEYYYNIEKPDAAPDQRVSLLFQFLFPKK